MEPPAATTVGPASEVTIEPLVRSELDRVLDWAADEGWNPGLSDADAFWAADPHGFFGVRGPEGLRASISLVSYGGRYGFAGLFIVRPDLRGKGLGAQEVREIMAMLRARLRPDAAIAIDGVFDMQPYYASLGFRFLHRNMRMVGPGRSAPEALDLCVDVGEVDPASLAQFDEECFGAPRPEFLEAWLSPVGGRAVAMISDAHLDGYGVIRPCRSGFKIGPLFARRPAVAETLFRALADVSAGRQVALDIPEVNADAVDLARRHGLSESFGCARMAMGPDPAIDWQHVYGVTTFELG